MQWMKLQRQLDPIYGVVEWADFMDSVMVLAHVPVEPRKPVPLEWIRGALDLVDTSVLWEVQAAHLMLMLLFTFARSETPLPKAHTGEGAFAADKNLTVADFKVVPAQGELAAHAGVRLKAVKQDPRMERASTRGN